MTQRLLLVDSASQYYRAFYGVPDSMRDSSGRPVNAVRGFFTSLTRAVEQFQATRLVLCWDEDWRPAFRTTLIPAYKAHRLASDGTEAIPDDLAPQVDTIIDIAAGLGLTRIGVAGFEADDVIATIAKKEAGPVAVLTGDRDLFQVIDDRRNISVWYTGKGPVQVFSDLTVRDRYGVPALQYADFATLRGDPSDGLSGVRGIGDKGAAALLSEHESLERVLAAANATDSNLRPRLRDSLRDALEYLTAAQVVVRVRTDVPLPDYDDRLRTPPTGTPAIADLIARTGMTGTVERWAKTVAQVSAA